MATLATFGYVGYVGYVGYIGYIGYVGYIGSVGYIGYVGYMPSKVARREYPVIVKLCCALKAMVYPRDVITFRLTPLGGTWPYIYDSFMS